ncbi:MAG: DUF59 domain-containing protein [Saprospiraceae bacterium]|nr:DUF59 domain-containing protein [Saprospiraceae bacterium]
MTRDKIFELLNVITCPENSGVTISELGMLKDVQLDDDKVIILICPLENECSVMNIILKDIEYVLKENNLNNLSIIFDQSAQSSINMLFNSKQPEPIVNKFESIIHFGQDSILHNLNESYIKNGDKNSGRMSCLGEGLSLTWSTCQNYCAPFDLYFKAI